MLKQVGVKQLENKAVVLSKLLMVQQAHDVMLVSRVLSHYVAEVISLLMGELVVHFRVPCYLYSDRRQCRVLVVDALDNLGEAALAKCLHDLVPVRDVVANLGVQIALNVVKQWITLVVAIFLVRGRLSLFKVFYFLGVCLFQPPLVSLGPLRDISSKVDLGYGTRLQFGYLLS